VLPSDKGEIALGAGLYIHDSSMNVAALRTAGHFAIGLVDSADKGIEAPRKRKWDEGLVS